MRLLFQSKLFANGVLRARLEFARMHRQYRLTTVEEDLQVATFCGLERRALFAEPFFELLAVHGAHYTVLMRNAIYLLYC